MKTRSQEAMANHQTQNAASPSHPISLWPYYPAWELDGFDFRPPQPAKIDGIIKACFQRRKPELTTGIPQKKRSQTHRSRLVADGVAVLFRAMLYCQDYHGDQVFWQRVRDCMPSFDQGPRTMETLANFLIQARTLYLQSTEGCPIETARLVDEWINLPWSGRTIQPLGTAPWDVRSQEWNAMVKRGELTNLGYAPPSSTPQKVLRRDAPAPNLQRSQQLAAKPLTPREYPTGPVVKREDTEERPSDRSRLHRDIFIPHQFSSERKRQRTKSPAGASRSHPPDRRRARLREPRETPQDDVQFSESLPASAGDGITDEAAAVTHTEHERYQSPEPGVPESPPPSQPSSLRKKSNKKLQFRIHEEKLAQQLNLIYSQASKLSTQEELATQHAAEIKGLDSRLKSLEEAHSVQPEARTKDKELEELQQSVSGLTSQINNRDSYIRTEIKKNLVEVTTPLEREQGRLDKRIDSLRDDMAIQKARIKNWKRAVNKHSKQGGDQGADLRGVETSLKRHRGRISKLTSRLDGLEEKLTGNAASSISEDSDENEEGPALLEDQFSTLGVRIDKLEENQQAVIEQMLQRLDALETGQSTLKETTEASRAALEERAKRQEERLTKQESETNWTTKELTNLRARYWNSTQSAASTHSGNSYYSRPRLYSGRR
ncbi:hypothetical protein N658DRAFT_103110 [Parathielavia hyrcaniae]|uniref:Uncharacterized protein n=1 Tax=Parathielavia hyrcaniae TaxID=113614 RepID=A0AAN6PYR1_9PEZI|nr:hypothetical protein N658DRAFT_103110 [Parathielavia hyrcaniae]